jgi:hypothetical protein
MIGYAQITVDFEDLTLSPDSFWVGADGGTGFSSHGAYFPTNWDDEFGYWIDGFAYSNMTDSITSGYMNMYSCKAGIGNAGSANFALAYDDGNFYPGEAAGLYAFEPLEMYITNNTFAYNNMRDGDAFSKKFGGDSGNDPDFFTVTFTGLRDGEATGTPVVVRLADFTFADNSLDYIQRDWLRVDLTPLGIVDSIAFSFESSDVGEFGINTPKYFCMDDFKMNVVPNAIPAVKSSAFAIYPNPTSDFITIQHPNVEKLNYEIYSATGALVRRGMSSAPFEKISVADFDKGLYLIRLQTGNGVDTRTFVIQ